MEVKNQFTLSERLENTLPPPTSGSLIGKKFGKLTVVGYVDYTKENKFSKRKRHVWVECDCGESNKLVDKGSLTRGATTSCGCNYQNNGATIPLDKTWYEDKVKDRFYVIGDYYGYNNNVKVCCIHCDEVQESLAKSLAFLSCSKCSLQESTSARYMKDNGFTLVEGETNTYNCKHCNIDRHVVSTLGYKCPCLRDIESPVSVYLLSSPTKPYVKIGKAINPYQRLTEINKSGGDDFEVVKYWWVSGDKCAYLLESHLHKKHGGKGALEREGFSGDTEIFNVSVDEVVAYMKSINKSLKSLRKGVVPPNLQEMKVRFKLPTKLQDYSFDFDGYHYPSPAAFWQGWLGLYENRYNLQGTLEFLDFHKTHYNVLNQGVWNSWGYTYSEYIDRLLSTNLSHKTVAYRAGKGIPYDEILNNPLEKANWLYIDGVGYPRNRIIDKLFPSCVRSINSLGSKDGGVVLQKLLNFVFKKEVKIFSGGEYSEWELSIRGLTVGNVEDIMVHRVEFSYENSLKFLEDIEGSWENYTNKATYITHLTYYYFTQGASVSCIKPRKQSNANFPTLYMGGDLEKLTVVQLDDSSHFTYLGLFKEINNIKTKNITLTNGLISTFKNTL